MARPNDGVVPVTPQPPDPEVALSRSDRSHLARVAAKGDTAEVATMVESAYLGLIKHPGGEDERREILEALDEARDTAHPVALALQGRVDEMAAWLQSVWMDGWQQPPDRQQAVQAKLDRIWKAITKAVAEPLPRPPLEPDWVRAGGPDPTVRLELAYKLRVLFHRFDSHRTLELGPSVMVMVGTGSRVRVPRARVASVRWLLGQTDIGLPINRFAFLDHAGELVGYWDIDGGQSKQAYSWFGEQEFPTEKLTGSKADRDPYVQLPLQPI